MANTWKSLGQVQPAANTLTDAYTVPGATSAVVSSICCANDSDQPSRVRITHAIAGAADADAQTFVPKTKIPAREPYILTIGPTLAATDKIRVWSDTGKVAFNIWGQEIT